MAALTGPAWLLLLHITVVVWSLVWTLRTVRKTRGALLFDDEVDPAHNTHSSPPLGTVDIIVPARNEEHNLADCIGSLRSQISERVRVTIVDDHSEDRTFAIASELSAVIPAVRVIRSAPLPAGWVGKNHALHQGSELATSEWLLFLDADVRLALHAVSRALEYAQRHCIDLFSLSPRQEAKGALLRVVQAAVFQLLNEEFDLRRVSDPGSSAAAANGQFLLIRRSVYLQLGGHEAVKAQILEDVALARLVKAAGFRVFFATTMGCARAAMYRSVGEWARGWSKNLFELLGSSTRGVLRAIFRELMLGAAPFATMGLLLAHYWPFRTVDYVLVVGSIAFAFLVAGQVFLMGGQLGSRGLALWGPVARCLLIAVIANSWISHVLFKRVAWKGRVYAPPVRS